LRKGNCYKEPDTGVSIIFYAFENLAEEKMLKKISLIFDSFGGIICRIYFLNNNL
jgi:hypothetical protein